MNLSIKKDWLIGECRSSSMRFGSPLIEKVVLKKLKIFFTRIAVKVDDGRKMVIATKDFDKTKEELGEYYYSKYWKTV